VRVDWGHWLYGLVSGFIGGGAGAIGTGFGEIVLDPQHVAGAGGLHHVFALMGISFLFTGIITSAAYLKQSPLPQMREIWTDEQRAAANKPSEAPKL
jgi:hypothetical protein